MEIKTFFSIWKHQVQANELNLLVKKNLHELYGDVKML
jgi:hypothetical protein